MYPDKISPAAARYHYTRDAILRRAQLALAKLYDRPEKVIIVVSHSGFLRAGVSGSWYQNADYRIFDIVRSPLGTASPAPIANGSNEADVADGTDGANGTNGANGTQANGVEELRYKYSVSQHESTKKKGEKGGGMGWSSLDPVALGTALPLVHRAEVDGVIPN